jgi:hypothetical protein
MPSSGSRRTVRRLTAWFALLTVGSGTFLTLSVCYSDAQLGDHREGFPPLASVLISVSVSDSQASRVVAALRTFAATENLTIQEGQFPRAGRPVVQVTLRQGDRIIFHISNFSSQGVFRLTVYSHGGREVWAPIWTRLLSRLSDVVGSTNIHQDPKAVTGHQPP